MINVHTGVKKTHKNNHKCKRGNPKIIGWMLFTKGKKANWAINGMMNKIKIMNFLFNFTPPTKNLSNNVHYDSKSDMVKQ